MPTVWSGNVRDELWIRTVLTVTRMARLTDERAKTLLTRKPCPKAVETKMDTRYSQYEETDRSVVTATGR